MAEIIRGTVAFDKTVVSLAINPLLFANFKMHFCSIFHVMLLPQLILLICVGLNGDLLLMLCLFYFFLFALELYIFLFVTGFWI